VRRALVQAAPRSALRLVLTREELGRAGEAIAARFLEADGWRVVARRLATRSAEVDLVVRRGDELACVEVKTGRVPFDGDEPRLDWRPGLRVERAQRLRLHRAARELARAEGVRARVDLVEVCVERGGRRVAVLHHPHADRPPGRAPPSLARRASRPRASRRRVGDGPAVARASRRRTAARPVGWRSPVPLDRPMG
jgi:putative endonuclease